MVDDSGEGSVMSIMENINDDTSLDVCKVPPSLEVGKTRLLKSVRQVRTIELNPRMVL